MQDLPVSPTEFVPALQSLLKSLPMPAGHNISGYAIDENPEARAYSGCTFTLVDTLGGETRVVFRTAKLTPTKAGLFVTLWKRDESGITRPYKAVDEVDEFWIVADTPHGYGHFAFTAQQLLDAGVLTSSGKPGKRGFRLYTPWDKDLNPSAARAWAWQRRSFTALER